MLLLRRRAAESIVIRTSDGTIAIQVLKIRGNSVLIGFDAPGPCEILRSELICDTDETARPSDIGTSSEKDDAD